MKAKNFRLTIFLLYNIRLFFCVEKSFAIVFQFVLTQRKRHNISLSFLKDICQLSKKCDAPSTTNFIERKCLKSVESKKMLNRESIPKNEINIRTLSTHVYLVPLQVPNNFKCLFYLIFLALTREHLLLKNTLV